MNLEHALDLCETMLDKKYITHPYDYLMEFHFFINFWKKTKTMNIHGIIRFLKILHRIRYFEVDP